MIDFEGREIPETLQEVVDPKRTVLLVMIHWGIRTIVMVGCTTDGGVEGRYGMAITGGILWWSSTIALGRGRKRAIGRR